MKQRQKQAFHAISLYYELGLVDSGEKNLLKDKKQNLSIKKEGLKLSGAHWVMVYDSLKNEMS